MTTRQRKYPIEEFSRRGKEMYQKQIRPLVEAGNYGKIVAIDIDSGAFEVDEDPLPASEKLLARLPDAQIWCERIGYPAVYRLGYHGPWGDEDDGVRHGKP